MHFNGHCQCDLCKTGRCYDFVGVLMVFAWVICAATGTILARYLKTEETVLTKKVLCGAQLWFRVNSVFL